MKFGWIAVIVCSLAISVRAGEGKFVNLGPQVSAKSIQGSEFLRDPSGRDVIYTVERGQPGHLLGYDVVSGQKIVDLPLPGCDGAWEVAASTDGYLYTSGGNGHMFRYKLGDSAAQDLGQAPPRQKVVWDVTPGPNGVMFAGTYPDALVVRYDPKNGFTDTGHGSIVPGENYVRSLVYDPKTKLIYVGVGSHAHLIELDPATGKKRELLAKQTHGQEAVYSLQIVHDEKSGDRLMAWVTNRGQTLVYNLRTHRLERQIPSADVKSVKKSPNAEIVYYGDGQHLMSIDLDRPHEAPRTLIYCPGINAMQWLDDDHLCILTRLGHLIDYDIQTGASTNKTLSLPPQPIPIQSMTLGPDGKIWMGGFLAGGTAVFDPRTGKSAEYRGMSQIEAFGALDGKLYLGIYPHGRLYQFNPFKAWGKDNPSKIAVIAGQSRPIAVLGVPELQKVFIGTVPEYGILGGHLVEYDPASRTLSDHGQVVARQSIISLVYSNAMIIGGTSITGGLGIEPSETQAKIFAWDPRLNRKIYEIVPVPGAIAITCLIVGPDKNVWGVADGTLFIFDPINRQVISRYPLVKVHYDTNHIWRDAFLLIHPSGQIYGTLDGKFFRLDPTTKIVTLLRNHDSLLLAMDRAGCLYFRDTVNLWKYIPPVK